MTRRASCFHAACALLLGALSSSCTTETESTGVIVATGTPSISITNPTEGSCVVVGSGADAYIPVAIKVSNIYLRTPGGACSGLGNCGHVDLTVNGVLNNTGAGDVIDVVFQGKIANHFDKFHIVAALKDDADKDWTLDTDGDAGIVDGGTAKYSAEVNIVAAPSCSSSGDAGADGG
jgi:hypothetical protein